jgi:uncharacterized membrane protein YqjE
MTTVEPSTTSVQPLTATPDNAAISTLEAICRLHAAGGLLSSQTVLLGQLFRVEWEEEKSRLLTMLLTLLLGFACLLCVMLFVGALVLVLSWETIYRTPAAVALIALYGLGFWLAWRHFQKVSAQSGEAFAATRAEISADLALLKSKL